MAADISHRQLLYDACAGLLFGLRDARVDCRSSRFAATEDIIRASFSAMAGHDILHFALAISSLVNIAFYILMPRRRRLPRKKVIAAQPHRTADGTRRELS